ncbi:polyprenol reductase [Lampris incognitus]|uniref:polyprenol reductase n=1 Tax=Lampris incognitus TaxID=2546036 RepID=UPI0024B57C49|nr:polyprenol reductase [Lampris incognitus]
MRLSPTRVIDILWFLLCLCFFLAFLVHRFSRILPAILKNSPVQLLFQDLIRYGKTKQRLKRDNWLRIFDIPKRWFWHFYAVSLVWNGLLLALSLNLILRDEPYPLWLTVMSGYLTGIPAVDSQTPKVSTLLVLLLLWIHSLRRLLECLLVSVFSEGPIHMVQYIFGLAYYIILGVTVLCADHLRTVEETSTLLSQLGWLHVAGTALFIWASLLQHRSLVLLAKLRTGSSGTVETLAHRIPNGGWFELVSCPHYFAELLVYVSLSLVFGGLSLTCWLVVLYVLFNQALAAQLCHEFYLSKFEFYPRHRKAFIPFVL